MVYSPASRNVSDPNLQAYIVGIGNEFKGGWTVGTSESAAAFISTAAADGYDTTIGYEGL